MKTNARMTQKGATREVRLNFSLQLGLFFDVSNVLKPFLERILVFYPQNRNATVILGLALSRIFSTLRKGTVNSNESYLIVTFLSFLLILYQIAGTLSVSGFPFGYH